MAALAWGSGWPAASALTSCHGQSCTLTRHQATWPPGPFWPLLSFPVIPPPWAPREWAGAELKDRCECQCCAGDRAQEQAFPVLQKRLRRHPEPGGGVGASAWLGTPDAWEEQGPSGRKVPAKVNNAPNLEVSYLCLRRQGSDLAPSRTLEP